MTTKDAILAVELTRTSVESLSAARKAAMHGSEPSDAIRVVNALLTAAIDDAFMDRADLKLHVGLPSASGALTLLRVRLKRGN
jgi:hypothetical protein